jgi:GH15 family glucan-1,4-alpha-glucosidase
VLLRHLEQLGMQAADRWDRPDAGIWEYCNRVAVHSLSSVLCWAACDRLALIAGALGLEDRQRYWRERADPMREAILARAWNGNLGSFVSTFGGKTVDASVLLLPSIGIIAAQDPRFLGSLDRIERELRHGAYL